MKKLLAILITAAIACTLTACGNGGEGQVSEENVAVAEMKTIEPPDDGWTLEQLNQVLYMNGQKIELPLMFSSLGDGYEIKDIHNYGTDDTYSGSLQYNNEFMAVIGYCETDNDLKITSLRFMPSQYSKSQKIENYIKINGFGLCDNTFNVYNYLGENYVNSSGFIIYVIGDNEYTVAFTDVDEKYQISIFEGVKEYN